jgi:hypothetical protein
MMKNLEDLHGNLECVAMARKWNMEQRKPWKEKGTKVCKEVLSRAAQALDRANEFEVAKTHLRIF